MSNYLQRLFVVAVLASAITLANAADQIGKVKANRLNVRGQPRLQSEVVTQLKAGDQVVILEEIPIKSPPPGEPASWAKIAMPANTPVWVHGMFVENGVVTARRLNLRSGPGEQYSIVGRLEQNQKVKISRKVEQWLEIEPPPGTYAFVDGSLIETMGPAKPSAPVVAQAAAPKPAIKAPAPAVEPLPTPETPAPKAAAAPKPEPIALPEPVKVAEAAKAPEPIQLPEPVKAAEPVVAQPAPTPAIPVAAAPRPAAAQPFNVNNAQTLDERIIAMQMAGRTLPPSYPSAPAIVEPTPALPEAIPHTSVPNATPVVSTPYLPEDGSFPSIAEMEAEPERPAIKRVVRREGIVSKTISIQAPTYSDLEDPLTGRTINYLHGVNAGIDVKSFRGKKVIATGREGIDPRWPKVPVLFLETLETAP